jgi:hypothetical protein
MPSRARRGERNRVALQLEGLKAEEGRPDIAVSLVADDAKPIHVATAADDGTIDIPAAALKKAARVIVGPATDDPDSIDPETLVRYRPDDFAKVIEGGTFAVPRVVWEKWLIYLRCVSGKVQLCRRSPWWYESLYELATEPVFRIPIPQPDTPPEFFDLGAARLGASARAAAISRQPDASPVETKVVTRKPIANSVTELIAWPFRCQTICNGTVEVYRRTCCCDPWIIDDPRIPELFRDLEEIVEGLRRVPPWPPDPPPVIPPLPPDRNSPDPAPDIALGEAVQVERAYIEPAAIFKEGALDERAVYATTDLTAMRALRRDQLAEYINARPYLRCWHRTCGTPTKVATGTINWDGRFSICWIDWPHVLQPNCSEQYAFVVKQRFGWWELPVYNGVAANIWFNAGTDVTITSYSSLAYACRDNGEPGTGAFVYLDLIGDTESWNLKTPNAAAWNAVAAPAFNDGLVFPAPSIAAAWGQNLNRNWGGTLKLNYMFSEDMQAAPVGAKYYRIGITAANASGAPLGPPDYLSAGLSWDKSTAAGTVPVVLGPFTVGSQDSLYLIPFDWDIATSTNINWNAGQYHGYVNTAHPAWSDPTKRHLITLEVFDAAGARLRPTGTPATGAGGAEAVKPFRFERRYQDVGARLNVPYGALTHMFWWDNRPLEATIENLIQDGSVYTEECLFLVGTANSEFAIEYRAYHQEEMFQREHVISWQRGVPKPWISGSTGYLLPTASNNVGEFGPPAAAEASPTNKFSEMLRTDLDPTRTQCAFTVFLTISSKTTDGDDLDNHSITKTAAFVLEIG